MAIKKQSKTYDKEVAGLYTRHGKRGDTWNYARFKEGRLVRASLGSINDHTVLEARRWASNLNLEAAGKAVEYTLTEVIDKIVAKAKQKGSRKPEYIRKYAKLYIPDWLGKKLGDVTKAMVSDRQDKVAAERGNGSAHMFLTALKVVYGFADLTLDWEGRSPVRGVKATKPRPRQVVWTLEQQSRFMEVCKADSDYWHNFFTVLANTGMRRGNLQNMEWCEVAGDTWTIPPSKFKTKIAHTVTLRPEVVAAIEGQRGLSDKFVFPSMRDMDKPLGDGCVNSSFLRLCKLAGVTGVTMHDLRRTLGTRLAARFPVQVVSQVLGHRDIATTMRHYIVRSEADARAALLSL